MTYSQRAGKLGPRLAEDIQLYDPEHPPSTGLNLLSEVPPIYPSKANGQGEFVSSEACKHNYVTKSNQTILAEEGQHHRPGMSSKVSAMCSKCRYHLQLVVNHTSAGASFTRSQKGEHIHHLIYKSGRQRGSASVEEVTTTGQVAETYHFECSHFSCSAKVSLRILSPLINQNFVQLLTDTELIRKRADEAIAASPDRLEGMTSPLPITVLDNLRIYLSNSLHNRELTKDISAINKRFMVAFGLKGTPCKEVLEFLRFKYLKENGAWQPPKPEPESTKPYQNESSIFLDDAILELQSLIHNRPNSEKRAVQTSLPQSSSSDILHALEASDYPKSLHASTFEMAPAPFYEDLGAVEDMDSSLIVEAYNRQVSVDPSRSSLYLGSLKAIGHLRGGQDWEIIDHAAQLAYAEGKYTDDDVIEAYKYFGMWHDDPNITEDTIIGKFHAYLSSTSRETEARQQLWRIGNSRGSERIKAVSEDRVSNVEQAQVFLGVDDKTPDDFIITMYTAKVNDSPSCKDTADRAVKLIAESRQSIPLKHFLDTGETVSGEMDIGDAYRLLQIPDRTADEEAVMAAYTICIDDSPDQAELYNRALSVIAKEMDSQLLKGMAGISSEANQNPTEWPVGLQNIGNTCYLNSLLQFYFSVRPFRDMVLDIEKYQMDMNDESGLSKKKVGSRKVTAKEVQRSLTFLGELRTLFQNMTTSSSSCVAPSRELARLTLISPGNEEAIRRRSTVSKPQTLGDIEGAPILGPLGPPQPIVNITDGQPGGSDGPQPTLTKNGSEAESEETLVSENNGPDLPANSAGDGNEQAQSETALSEAEGYVKIEANNIPEHPSRPPPVPPRPVVEVDRQKQLLEEVEIGAQQDVTEVINNVLFQSQCAIKPLKVASDGEQVDQIKDLFYGESRSYISTEAGIRSKEERWCDIKVDVAHGSRDIYSAIDGAFDAQKISVENSEAEQFGSITRLPPILQIQVQRVQFDAVKKSSFKSTNHLELLETIYMDRYMDTKKPEIVNKRRQGWDLKKALKAREQRRLELTRKQEPDGQDMAQLFRSTRDVLRELPWDDEEKGQEDVNINESLSNEVDQLAQTAEAEFQALESEIDAMQAQISNQFSEYQNLPYRLYAVFVHRGSVSFGHYWIYIYDFNRDIWRKYNDEYVTEVQNLDEIFKNNDPVNPPTPYFLVYINDRLRDRLVDPVCRDIPEPMPDVQDQDINVADAVQPTESTSEAVPMDQSTD